MTLVRRAACLVVVCAAACAAAIAAVVPEPTRFDRLVIHHPGSRIGIAAEALEAVAPPEDVWTGWERFRAAHGTSWQVWMDRRSGSVLLAEGEGIPWFGAAERLELGSLEATARSFVLANEGILGVREAELVLDPAASRPGEQGRAVLVFSRAVDGVPVDDERFVLQVNRGRLVSFGATRWGPIARVPSPSFGDITARELLRAYMGLTELDQVEEVAPPRLELLPWPVAATSEGRYTGAPGAGIEHRLAWRLALRVAGEPGTWVGAIDARTGSVLAFFDDDKYAQLKGGVFPVSNDGDCVGLGCELPGFPMPYADVMIGRKRQTTDDMGMFTCGKGSKSTTTNLLGPYVRMTDRCGYINESGNCSSDVDLGTSAGTDCTVPAGHNAGDTHASRVNFYVLNRIKEKGRYWLPGNAWLTGQLNSKVNTSATCNAFWDGTVNFYRSGGGCRNTGEIAGVVAHEYGHGLDQNDGGGYDNPSEAYGDVVAILQDRASCVGRGFFQSRTCSGYGDTCLTCTGIRDMDWDARVRHTPATPANFTASSCGGGGGPCGREVHCESYVPSEAIYDLAVRDLPASGLDADTSWQLAEKLFYSSRQGSGGNAFNCALPSSDGCNASSWFTKLRNADDDDGNLGNGTPHAAAIHAAFARHGIACGAATDPSNQSTSSCPALSGPVVSASSAAGSVTLSWAAVPGAARYLVLRNEVGCGSTSNVIATVTGTSFTDTNLPAAFALSYRVQAQGSNDACESPVSACVEVAAQ